VRLSAALAWVVVAEPAEYEPEEVEGSTGVWEVRERGSPDERVEQRQGEAPDSSTLLRLS
jgi:hypothetical protein